MLLEVDAFPVAGWQHVEEGATLEVDLNFRQRQPTFAPEMRMGSDGCRSAIMQCKLRALRIIERVML